jgi:CRP-like cAMP-binding protein
MPCDPSELRDIPIFSLLDAEERAVLGQHVELRRFASQHRIYRIGDPGAKAYLVLRGKVQVAMIDDDHQEVVIDTPGPGGMFGLSSMLADAPHQTTAQTLEATTTLEIDRDHLAALIVRKPMAGLDMLTVVSRQVRAAQDLVRANLFLPLLAAVQAPVIMMSQNRQDAKDRVRSELDFAVNRKAEVEITQLAAKLNRIEERVDDIHEALMQR